MTISPNSNSFRYIRNNPYAPAKNVRHHFAAQHAMAIYKQNAIYSLIPKNACSTMRYSLAVENGFLSSPEQARWVHENLYTFTSDLRGLVTADYSFTILRCPFSRLASCYIDKIVGNQLDIWNLLPIYATDEKAENVTFRRFVEILKNRGILRSNIHWQPQIDFLVYSNYSDYFSLEKMDHTIATLKAKIGLTVHDTRDFFGHDRSGYDAVDGNFTDMPAYEIANLKRDKKIPNYQSLFDADIYDQVSQIFADDLELYKSKIGLEYSIKR